MAGNNHMTKEGTSEMLCMETLPWNDVQVNMMSLSKMKRD